MLEHQGWWRYKFLWMNHFEDHSMASVDKNGTKHFCAVKILRLLENYQNYFASKISQYEVVNERSCTHVHIALDVLQLFGMIKVY